MLEAKLIVENDALNKLEKLFDTFPKNVKKSLKKEWAKAGTAAKRSIYNRHFRRTGINSVRGRNLLAYKNLTRRVYLTRKERQLTGSMMVIKFDKHVRYLHRFHEYGTQQRFANSRSKGRKKLANRGALPARAMFGTWFSNRANQELLTRPVEKAIDEALK
jgi:hypothetical protein